MDENIDPVIKLDYNDLQWTLRREKEVDVSYCLTSFYPQTMSLAFAM